MLINQTSMTFDQIPQLSDRELHKMAGQFGANARKWQKQFASLLSEIVRRKLYKKYGCISVYQYAKKLCGMSEFTVDDILNVHSRLSDKPALIGLMPEQGWSKLKILVTVATPETQKFWAKKVRQMSRNTLITFIQELRKQNDFRVQPFQNSNVSGHATEAGNPLQTANPSQMGNSGQTANSLQAGNPSQMGISTEAGNSKNLDFSQSQNPPFTNFSDIFKFSAGFGTPACPSQKEAITFKLNLETETKLRIFKHRLEKEKKEPLDWDQVMRELLEIAEQGSVVAKTVPQKAKTDFQESKIDLQKQKDEIKKKLPVVSSRHIPAKVEKILEQEYKGKCGYPNCKWPAEIKQHTRRFALIPNHDPDFIVPLCKNHERIAHHGLIKDEESKPINEDGRPNWAIQAETDKSSPKYHIDEIVNKYRRPG